MLFLHTRNNSFVNLTLIYFLSTSQTLFTFLLTDRKVLLVAGSVGPYGACLHDGSEYRGDYISKISFNVRLPPLNNKLFALNVIFFNPSDFQNRDVITLFCNFLSCANVLILKFRFENLKNLKHQYFFIIPCIA